MIRRSRSTFFRFMERGTSLSDESNNLSQRMTVRWMMSRKRGRRMDRMKGTGMRHKIGIAGGMLALAAGIMWPADKAREQKYQQAVDLYESKGDAKGAVKLFEEVSKSPDRNLAARALLYLGSCYEKLGPEEARKAYERV